MSCSVQTNYSSSNGTQLLGVPDNWTEESFSLPPAFAPTIKIAGMAEVRFAPEWDDRSSDQFWTYAFGWYIDGVEVQTSQQVSELIQTYFTGLSLTNSDNQPAAADQQEPAVVNLEAAKNDFLKEYRGNVTFFDNLLTGSKITLNMKIEEVTCEDLGKQHITVYLSPTDFEDSTWKLFDRLRKPTDCASLPKQAYEEIVTDDYVLVKPKTTPSGVLIVFPGFPENPQIVRREFNVEKVALYNGLAVVFMSFNQKIWLEEDEKAGLARAVEAIFEQNNLPTDNVYVGGFSSGGNVSLLMGDYLAGTGSSIIPKGVFAVDSPIDILGLYENSKKNIRRDLSDVSVQESKMIIDIMDAKFGKPEEGIHKYEEYAVFTTRTDNVQNLSNLKGIEIRLYTEPDQEWWKANRGYDYEETNSYFFEQLYEELSAQPDYEVEYIPTANRGYRSSGERHPHSWSIVDVDKLVEWMLPNP